MVFGIAAGKPLPRGRRQRRQGTAKDGLWGLRVVLVLGLFWLVLDLGTATSCARSTGSLGLLEAVRVTLANQPSIKLQEKQVEFQAGVRQEAGGRFDLNLEAFIDHDQANLPKSSLDQLLGTQRLTANSQYSAGVVQQFRNGVTISPQVRVNRQYTDDPHYPTTNRARVDFAVIVPLMKGWGKTATGAKEMAAAQEVQNTLLVLRHTASQSVYTTILAYWRFLAAEQSLQQLKQSEDRSRRFVQELKKLIAADERPAADLEQMLADLASKTASRIAGEQRLYQARYELGLAMGLPFERISQLPLPQDPFPAVKKKDISILTQQASKISELAVTNRSDYMALLGRQETRKILLEAARNNLLPRVDLNVRLGYAGLKEGDNLVDNIESYADNVPGMSAGIGVAFQWPVQNNAARGIYRQTKAGYDQVVISTEDLGRTIKSRVDVAISDLQKASLQLHKSQDAVRAYRKTVHNELIKFRLGIATLIDLITVENQLIDASLREIAAAANYANALAGLRFETGTLIEGNMERATVNRAALTTIPLPPKH